ncbi:MAG: alanine racemase, partial [Gemmatimonadetes bacterium]|nr:alanine racemase [Gemmatimonadota bacterium]NIR78362.1 alanine racemase [Gemmatimonadota bacterium]NIT86955.1 alanine racemase [Gemmatimonadota bacterium]NIU30802.1 alanine racemase [Gemmatimonadota bacterium]NIU35582.1 alanine racemase [Gemmatimonadota bacterium]
SRGSSGPGPSRRRFLAAALGSLGALSAAGGAAGASGAAADPAGGRGDRRTKRGSTVSARTRAAGPGFDPWIEVEEASLAANAAAVRRLAGGRPIHAVIKNHGYGHGVVEAGRILARQAGVAGLAVVKVDEALALREAGVEAPVLHMGYAPDGAARALVDAGVSLSAFQADDPERLGRLADRAGRAVGVHVYLDTGMSRMGIPVEDALPWLERLAAAPGVEIRGTYAAFVEEDEVDPVQIRRLRAFGGDARAAGLDPGPLHAASTHGLFHRMPEAAFDRARPGLALYGAYPVGADRSRAELTPALRLRARVVRTERLEAGEGVTYGYEYVAEAPTWIATIPVGHADGYARRAVEGCRVLVGGETHPVIGAVSASHTIVEVGPEERVRVGDDAVLVGPDDPAVHPNAVSEATGISVYDVLMHLSPGLPRRVV